MFSKHVWHDRRHQAEVFATEEGAISGTMIAYEGAVTMINPRPEILLALYQEGKIKRILAVKAVILTSDAIEVTRGLCAFVNYCRGLRRRSPLTIVAPAGTTISMEFLDSCCALLWGASDFEIRIAHLAPEERLPLGKGWLRFRAGAEERPYLIVGTEKGRTLHYYDESHAGPVSPSDETGHERPNVTIRAAQVPSYLHYSRSILQARQGVEG
ncbi:MAG TPA: hypothetical protein VHI13_17155 [Candidatus Kapabacteria bacterium]|nr:hypothetical protein [Candidatus Kapabacteria bacterium]